MIPNDSDVGRAFELITETFALNKVSPGIGFSACFNTVVNVLIRSNVPNEKINELLDAFESCIMCLDAEAVIERLPT